MDGLAAAHGPGSQVTGFGGRPGRKPNWPTTVASIGPMTSGIQRPQRYSVLCCQKPTVGPTTSMLKSQSKAGRVCPTHLRRSAACSKGGCLNKQRGATIWETRHLGNQSLISKWPMDLQGQRLPHVWYGWECLPLRQTQTNTRSPKSPCKSTFLKTTCALLFRSFKCQMIKSVMTHRLFGAVAATRASSSGACPLDLQWLLASLSASAGG